MSLKGMSGKRSTDHRSRDRFAERLERLEELGDRLFEYGIEDADLGATIDKAARVSALRTHPLPEELVEYRKRKRDRRGAGVAALIEDRHPMSRFFSRALVIQQNVDDGIHQVQSRIDCSPPTDEKLKLVRELDELKETREAVVQYIRELVTVESLDYVDPCESRENILLFLSAVVVLKKRQQKDQPFNNLTDLWSAISRHHNAHVVDASAGFPLKQGSVRQRFETSMELYRPGFQRRSSEKISDFVDSVMQRARQLGYYHDPEGHLNRLVRDFAET